MIHTVGYRVTDHATGEVLSTVCFETRGYAEMVRDTMAQSRPNVGIESVFECDGEYYAGFRDDPPELAEPLVDGPLSRRGPQPGEPQKMAPGFVLTGDFTDPPSVPPETRVKPVTLDQTTNPKDLVGQLKPAPGAVPPVAILHEAMAMADGAAKYGPYNWRQHPVRATIYIDACMRHLFAWLDGEEEARDSGHHHLGHARACLGILLDARETGNLVDDRPEPGPSADFLERNTKGK